MRRWGIIVTSVYALVLYLLYTVGFELLMHDEMSFETLSGGESGPADVLVWVLLLVLCQVALLVVTVDNPQERLLPRQHVRISITLIAFCLALLTLGVVLAVWAAVAGDSAADVIDSVFTELPVDRLPVGESARNILAGIIWILVPVLVLWTPWALIFRRFYKDDTKQSRQLFKWLYTGSVLELLIVVPCHIIVRSREDCSAPVLTAFGIATGLSIMLLAFGPSVVYLYRRQLEKYPRRDSPGV